MMASSTCRDHALDDLAVLSRSTRAYGDLTWSATSFAELPVTSKTSFKTDPGAFATPHAGRPARWTTSSGTSGPPTITARTSDDAAVVAGAVAERMRGLLDADLVAISLVNHNGFAVGPFVEDVLRLLDIPLHRGFPFDGGRIDVARLVDVAVAIEASLIIGTPGTVLAVEEAAAVAGRFDELATSVRHIATMGATITPGLATRIARRWNAKVRDFSFGSSETTTIATGCKAGKLHALDDRFVLEVSLPSGEVVPLGPGASGRLIVTPLDLRAQVLLRYDTEDSVSVIECCCGTGGTAFRVHGRPEDVVLAGDVPVGQPEVEDAVFAIPAVADYVLEIDQHDRVRVARLLAFPGSSEVDASPIVNALSCDVAWVSQLPASARTGGLFKSWRRTRCVQRRYDEAI